MASKKISELTDLPSPADSDELEINDAGVSKKITVQNLNRTFSKTVKNVDEIINDDSTLQDDDVLKFTPTINKVYSFMLVLIFQTDSASSGFRYALSLPTGATAGWISGTEKWASVTEQPLVDATATLFLTLGSTATQIVETAGKIEMSSTAGDINVQWAQFTPIMTDTTLEAGSYFVVWEE